MNKNLIVVLFIVAGVVCSQVESCTSCGSECQSSCGTKFFRSCCFNYMKKKRTIENVPNNNENAATIGSNEMDPSLRLELWLARSRNPYFSLFQHHPANRFLFNDNTAANLPNTNALSTKNNKFQQDFTNIDASSSDI